MSSVNIKKRSTLPGSPPHSVAASDAVDAQMDRLSRRSGPLALLTPPTAPPLTLGLTVAASLVVGETLILYPLRVLAPENTLGLVYALGVVVVAIVWGFWLAAATSVVSVGAFDFFHLPPIFSLTPTSAWDVVALTIYLILAMLASTVSERARADVADAYQRRREFERFFHLSSDLMGIRGTDGYFKRVNPAFEQTLGYSSDELLKRRFRDIVDPGAASAALDTLDEFSSHGGPVRFEDRCLRSDGTVVWLDWTVVSDQGVIYGAARDITERRRHQHEQRVLADQQASLRRVATLIARGVAPSAVFSAVAAELARCLGVHHSCLFRYERDGTGVLLAAGEDPGWMKVPIGTRVSFAGDNIPATVYRTGRTTRMDRHRLEHARGVGSAYLRKLGVRSTVGAPIIVAGRLWGVAGIASTQADRLPPDVEARITDFTELVATAIANAQTHAELTASRVRIVAAADDARRRFERDLHDGAQQRLVALGFELRALAADPPGETDALAQRISKIVDGLAAVSKEVQEISRGIHPAILSKGGLGPALKVLSRRSTVPVELQVNVDRRLPDSTEVAAYYVVAESLTNAAKHARASQVNVRVEIRSEDLHLEIRDDGIGGADTANGSGLIGLVDRVEACGGAMSVVSEPGAGTSLKARIPVDAKQQRGIEDLPVLGG
jgi:PAS domain S-box-containing protein